MFNQKSHNNIFSKKTVPFTMTYWLLFVKQLANFLYLRNLLNQADIIDCARCAVCLYLPNLPCPFDT